MLFKYKLLGRPYREEGDGGDSGGWSRTWSDASGSVTTDSEGNISWTGSSGSGSFTQALQGYGPYAGMTWNNRYGGWSDPDGNITYGLTPQQLADQTAANAAAADAAQKAAADAAAQEAARVAAEKAAAEEATRVEAARVEAERVAAEQEAARVEAARKEAERIATDRANREQAVVTEQAQTRSILQGVPVAGFAAPTSITADAPDVNKIGPAANIGNTNLASINSSITKSADEAQPSKDPESLVNRVGIIGSTADESQAETNRLKAMSRGEEGLGHISPGSNVPRNPEKNEALSVLDKVAGWASLIPGAQVLTAPYALGRLAYKTYSDATNDEVSAGETVGNLVKGIVTPRLVSAANGIIGNALGPDGAQLLGNYAKVAMLNNLVSDDKMPTSPGGYLMSKAASDPSYSDGYQHAANGDIINVGGFSSVGSSGNYQAPTQVATVAPTTPAAAAAPFVMPSGIIGNYLQWFNQGKGTLKHKGT